MDQYVYKSGKFSIITLKITGKTNENRKGIVNPDYAKFRTDKAYVVDIENFHTKEKMEEDRSMHESSFVYVVGKEVKVDDYDEDIDEVCTSGIHYFKTKEAAEGWWFGEHAWHYRRGLVKSWYETGELYSEINYNNDGYNDGSYKVWHRNEGGQLSTELNYKDGKLEGLCKCWHENGQLKKECNYKNGNLDGLYRRWFECGKLTEEKNYKEGFPLP